MPSGAAEIEISPTVLVISLLEIKKLPKLDVPGTITFATVPVPATSNAFTGLFIPIPTFPFNWGLEVGEVPLYIPVAYNTLPIFNCSDNVFCIDTPIAILLLLPPVDV